MVAFFDFEFESHVMVDHHPDDGVSPVSKSITYSIVEYDDKLWIDRNLGADRVAAAYYDNSPEAAGWYWQFNRKLGFKYEDFERTPDTEWISSINENSHWTSDNDPCAILLGDEWRIPAIDEWERINDWNGNASVVGAFASPLKIHAAGGLHPQHGILTGRGDTGNYWSRSQYDNTTSYSLNLYNSGSHIMNPSKTFGQSVRCVKDR
ncbi:MAG: hypothetical protein WD272_06340 [Balneolales bacterium]